MLQHSLLSTAFTPLHPNPICISRRQLSRTNTFTLDDNRLIQPITQVNSMATSQERTGRQDYKKRKPSRENQQGNDKNEAHATDSSQEQQKTDSSPETRRPWQGRLRARGQQKLSTHASMANIISSVPSATASRPAPSSSVFLFITSFPTANSCYLSSDGNTANSAGEGEKQTLADANTDDNNDDTVPVT